TYLFLFFFFQAEDGIRDFHVTGVQTCALPISWNILVGNTIAAVIGVSCALLIANPTEAFSLAVAAAIVLMMTTDSLHPPSGAVRSEERRVGKEGSTRGSK